MFFLGIVVRAVILVVVVMVVEALGNLVGRHGVFGGGRTRSAAQNQLDVVRG
jgi:hypothetical protein